MTVKPRSLEGNFFHNAYFVHVLPNNVGASSTMFFIFIFAKKFQPHSQVSASCGDALRATVYSGCQGRCRKRQTWIQIAIHYFTGKRTTGQIQSKGTITNSIQSETDIGNQKKVAGVNKPGNTTENKKTWQCEITECLLCKWYG